VDLDAVPEDAWRPMFINSLVEDADLATLMNAAPGPFAPIPQNARIRPVWEDLARRAREHFQSGLALAGVCLRPDQLDGVIAEVASGSLVPVVVPAQVG
jgi:hypothetical protein